MLGDVQSLLGKSKFHGHFHRVYLGAGAPSTCKVSSDLNVLFASPCFITLDSAKYLYLLKTEQKSAYSANLDTLAEDASWKRLQSGPHKPAYMQAKPVGADPPPLVMGEGHQSYVFARS
jgi:hypothetical protein